VRICVGEAVAGPGAGVVAAGSAEEELNSSDCSRAHGSACSAWEKDRCGSY
jgi:hypothetical protein